MNDDRKDPKTPAPMQQDHVYQLMLQPNDSDHVVHAPDADQQRASERRQLLQQKKPVEKKK